MALVSEARQKERELAAKARRKPIEEENLLGLVSIQAKRMHEVPYQLAICNTPEETQRNKDKHLHIIQWVTEVNAARKKQNTDWNQPIDWRMVTATTLHQYIPFEKQNVNIAQAVNYVQNQLAQFERPTKIRKIENEPTLIWHMSNNQLRTAVYKAAQTRTRLFRTF